MSKPVESRVLCKKCDTQQEFVLWQSLNVTLDRARKRQLLSGELTRFTCKNCGATADISYPMLYHDMERKLMIWLWPDAGEPDVSKVPFKLEDAYQFRLVRSRNDLVEKIYVFDADLDDRALEYMKLLIRVQSTDSADPLTGPIFFGGKRRAADGQDAIQFAHLKEGGTESFTVPLETFRQIEGSLAGKLPPARDEAGKWLRVDQDFARSLIDAA